MTDETKHDKNVSAEIEAGQARLKEHEEVERKRREIETEARKSDPVLHKPYIAGQTLDNPTPGFVRLENETEEEAENRKAAILAREEAIMTSREGGTPNPNFNPDAAEEERVRQERQKIADDEEQRLKDEAAAHIKSQIKATAATDEKAFDEADEKKAEEAKKAEGEDKAGDTKPGEDTEKATAKKKAVKKDDGDVLDDLLNS